MPVEGQYETSVADREFVQKLWGQEEIIINDPDAGYCGKLLWLMPGAMSSLHYHPCKTETFLAMAGLVGVEYMPIGSEPRTTLLRSAGREAIQMPPNTAHRFWAEGDEPALLVEFSTPHSDGDVVRLEESREFREQA